MAGASQDTQTRREFHMSNDRTFLRITAIVGSTVFMAGLASTPAYGLVQPALVITSLGGMLCGAFCKRLITAALLGLVTSAIGGMAILAGIHLKDPVGVIFLMAWPMIPLAALPGMVLAIAGHVVANLISPRRDPYPRNHCQRCGYTLTANVSGICPECGKPCEPDTSAT